MISNPVIPGFNPDPSIVRVGEDYYLACSTFEWYPGVAIYHSKDLVNWELITFPLNEERLLDMRGVPDSCGVWAPCLSYDDGKFYLVYSNVKSFDGIWKDTPNYLTTAESIHGPWSDPVYLGSEGFDGSMFHDVDGRKWYLSMIVDHREGLFFGGIILKEYSTTFQRCIGETYKIFEGTELGKTEGPHIYMHNGWYYLLTAEGGTEYGHAVTITRSKDIKGPYKVHPKNPILTAAHNLDHPIQRSGHGDLVWDEEGECYLFFLGSRPLDGHRACVLGRETCIEKVEWGEGEDDWPTIEEGRLPKIELDIKGLTQSGNRNELINFNEEPLSIHYQSLRQAVDSSWCIWDRDNGRLLLRGRDSLSSCFDQSLLARRVQSFNIEYEVSLIFEPDHFQQMAGVVCYYNTGHHLYIHCAGEEDVDKKVIEVNAMVNFELKRLIEPIQINQSDELKIRVHWQQDKIKASYQLNDSDFLDLDFTFGAHVLSDDFVREGGQRYRPAFTGSMIGIACQDLSGEGKSAAFNYLKYTEL